MILGFLYCFLLISADQAAKYLAVLKLESVGSITLIDGIFALTLVENRGAAFGFLWGGRWFFVCLTILILLGLIFYYYKLTKSPVEYGLPLKIALILIISGAGGNFIDRLRNGYVVDFFHVRFINFPVFNLADIFVVSGSILFAILLFFFVKEDKKNENGDDTHEAA